MIEEQRMTNIASNQGSGLKCWQFFNCKRKGCPAYKSEDLRCWLFSRTHCREQTQGELLEKIETCLECEVFKANADADAMRETLVTINRQLKAARETEYTLRDKIIEYEKLSALGRLTANVAHEIRNPVTVIGGLAQRLKKRFFHDPKEREYLELISTEAKKLEGILKDVLVFSDKGVFRREVHDIRRVTDHALTAYHTICKDASITIARRFEEVPLIFIDESQVRVAIGNLISNAVDAMPGGGTLTVQISAEFLGGKNYVAVKVMDTGGGISEEKLSRIFEPFFTTKTIKSDAWLGLPITRKIVEGHGGLIKADSVVGKGSVFSLYFPYRSG